MGAVPVDHSSPIVLIANPAPDGTWLYESGVVTALHRQLQAGGPVEWLAVARPMIRRAQAVEPFRERSSWTALWETPRRLTGAMYRRVRGRRRAAFAEKLPPSLTSPQALARLLDLTRASATSHMVAARDSDLAIVPEAVAATRRCALATGADLVYCRQLDGAAPVCVSVRLLEAWAKLGSPSLWSLFEAPWELRPFGVVKELRLAGLEQLGYPLRCYPQQRGELGLADFWEHEAAVLAEIWKVQPAVSDDTAARLKDLVARYRVQFATALETYGVVGDFDGLDELRKGMVTTRKPVVEYFVISTHLLRFLQRYAGLTPRSRVLDVGCSWGYFGFVLAGHLGDTGAYLGIEVQESAVRWAQQHLGWLGGNYQFLHLNIHNDIYNPDGTIARDQVRLPVADRWADVIVAGSVFTHMQEDGVRSYLREFHRVLQPGGVAAFSYDDSSAFGVAESYRVVDSRVPDKMTIYSRQRIRQLVLEAGLVPAHEPVNLRLFDRTDYQTWYFATPAPDAHRG